MARESDGRRRGVPSMRVDTDGPAGCEKAGFNDTMGNINGLTGV